MRKPRLHLLDLQDRRTTDHRAGDAGVEHLRERGGVAQAAADLQIHRLGRREFDDDRAIAERSVARAIQIDNVQPVGAGTSRYWASRECGSVG